MKSKIFFLVFLIFCGAIFAENQDFTSAKNLAENGFWAESLVELKKVPTGHQSELQTTPDLPSRVSAMAACTLFTCVSGPSWFHPTHETTVLNMSTSESCTRQEGLEQASGVGWVKR